VLIWAVFSYKHYSEKKLRRDYGVPNTRILSTVFDLWIRKKEDYVMDKEYASREG